MTENTPYEWLPEHDDWLEKIASTDKVEVEWTRLKDVIKYKLDKNISLFLSQPNDVLSTTPLVTSSRAIPPGGLKLPPFPPRPRDENNPNEAPHAVLTETDARKMKETLFALLDSLEGTPFSIQRVCELCLHPRKHYKLLGKYLRAVERSLLVTSTWDTFPVSTSQINNQPISTSFPLGGFLSNSSAPPTPLFSPIPFLHDDARRSHSRSPPPSPLVLPAADTGSLAAVMPPLGSAVLDQKALGLVDELDDPSPGHLSDHPQALSATTSITASPSKPSVSLQDRFVRSSEEPTETLPEVVTTTSMENTTEAKAELVVDDPEKENRAG